MPSETTTPAPETGLLQACALLFLFRALARTHDEAQRIVWEEQIVRLVADLVPCSGGAVVLGASDDEIPEDCIALPLYVRGERAGLLAVWFGPEEVERLAKHREVLSAVATLAGAALDNVRDVERLRTENNSLRDQIEDLDVGIIGESAGTRKLLQMIARVAPRETSVLVLGESGTGKELVARALHRLSPRAEKPFIAINCAALTESLLESELFGHERALLLVLWRRKRASSRWAKAGRCFSMRLGKWRRPYRPNCCASCNSGSLSAWEAPGP